MEENSNGSEVELDETDIMLFDQLVKMGQVRRKVEDLEDVDGELKKELEALQAEQQRLREYRRELELLGQERIAHVEELRLIHADINLLETTVKNAEDAEKRTLEQARRLLGRSTTLRENLNSVRNDLHLPPELGAATAAVSLNFPSGLAILDDEAMNSSSLGDGGGERQDSMPTIPTPTTQQVPSAQQQQQSVVDMLFAQAQRVAAMHAGNIMAPPNVPSSSSHHHGRQLDQPPLGGPAGGDSGSGAGPSGGASSLFRQQPPPMKSCLSCHQQIHRNAPICPLCKAKSRSRNPKKPKRKQHDD